MPKKVIINILLIIAAFITVIFIGKHLGGAIYQITKWSIFAFVATWLAVFITALLGFGPIGTTPTWSVRKVLAFTAVFCIALSILMGGVFAATGAVVGTVATLIYYRGAL